MAYAQGVLSVLDSSYYGQWHAPVAIVRFLFSPAPTSGRDVHCVSRWIGGGRDNLATRLELEQGRLAAGILRVYRP